MSSTRSTAAQELRRALAQYATGVAIVTTTAADGSPVGLTVNSFASVSLEPPLVLWSLAHKAASLAAFRDCSHYLVHVLAADQLDLARRFATHGADRFGGIAWETNDRGLPMLTPPGVAWFECGNRAQYDEGDHTILVGRVDAYVCTGGVPLVFHDSRYVTELRESGRRGVDPWR
ncbi:MAG: flavin reductase family protein [Burkholderiales bacterium]|jgi:flavin reductase (DIM6/NTAB) family NADH-FMN oxidoreductase RutF|nr:flavin reductase family protein [Burkholderiales bacterium]